ncbi:hypothetical protein MKW94_005951 [Papaver nudicaule]|uniref:VWFA domain-containing protein n=1 Tax=Papaver nudicaule TaxID=74823 RepID=A0AA42B592_PAPNU|nr:hypothetical protein [Papaver nudicaule]
MRSDMHNDDEEPTQTEVFLELDGKVEARTIYKQEASAELSKFKVLLELKGVGSEVGRLGVDLVTVLDTSGSMRGERLEKMKIAMEFLVKKLGHNDRLSVVSFNRRGEKLCPLRQINDVSREAIIDQVRDLTARGTTNTESGLRLALKILEDRRYTQKRGGAIMLMSDGMEDAGSSNAASVPVSNVPVYTFAFGRDSDHQVLSHIAAKSNGGMFAAVPDSDSLNVAFSMALAGLLHVAIDDLTLTIAPKNGSQLIMENAGNYPVKRDTESLLDPVTIIFGTLYDRETRKVLLTLSEVEDHLAVDITYTYRVGGEKIVNVSRKDVSTEADNAEVLAEERRVETY